MRIAVAATPAVAIPTLNWLLKSHDELSFVLTQPDRPAGRGRGLRASAISEWGSQQNVVIIKPMSTQEMGALLTEIDLLLTIGYGVLLPTEILQLPRYGCLNLHFSLLPRWRGAAPVQRAIEAGDLVSGVTVFKLDEGMDTGPIFCVKRFALDGDITSDELFTELSLLGVEAVADAIVMIKGGVTPTVQPLAGVTRALKISKEECEINWNTSATEISAKIRAFTSVPGAWTRFRESAVKIDSIKYSELSLSPGHLSVKGKELFIGTSTTALKIGFLTPPGKARIDAVSWINGARLQAGDHFG